VIADYQSAVGLWLLLPWQGGEKSVAVLFEINLLINEKLFDRAKN
jgi:hypothetical protein